MTTISDDMIIKLGFEADGAISEMAKTAAALADVSVPAIRLECLKVVASILREPADHKDIVAAAFDFAAFVLHGTVPAKN